MTRSFRTAAVYLALAAMMLRALLPAGWMPAAAAASGSLITICTMDGPAMIALDGNGHLQKAPKHHQNGDGQGSAVCPFAAAPHFATSPAVVAAALQSAPAVLLERDFRIAGSAGRETYSPQSPRGPPSLA